MPRKQLEILADDTAPDLGPRALISDLSKHELTTEQSEWLDQTRDAPLEELAAIGRSRSRVTLSSSNLVKPIRDVLRWMCIDWWNGFIEKRDQLVAQTCFLDDPEKQRIDERTRAWMLDAGEKYRHVIGIPSGTAAQNRTLRLSEFDESIEWVARKQAAEWTALFLLHGIGAQIEWIRGQSGKTQQQEFWLRRILTWHAFLHTWLPTNTHPTPLMPRHLLEDNRRNVVQSGDRDAWWRLCQSRGGKVPAVLRLWVLCLMRIPAKERRLATIGNNEIIPSTIRLTIGEIVQYLFPDQPNVPLCRVLKQLNAAISEMRHINAPYPVAAVQSVSNKASREDTITISMYIMDSIPNGYQTDMHVLAKLMAVSGIATRVYLRLCMDTSKPGIHVFKPQGKGRNSSRKGWRRKTDPTLYPKVDIGALFQNVYSETEIEQLRINRRTHRSMRQVSRALERVLELGGMRIVNGHIMPPAKFFGTEEESNTPKQEVSQASSRAKAG